MLNSQITPSARNIPTYAATKVQTTEPKQCMWEDLLISGRSLCGRFTGMAEAAKVESAAMRGKGQWRDPCANGQRGAGAMNEAKKSIREIMTRNRGWIGSAELSEEIGISVGIVRNALHALVVERFLEKDTVSRGSGFGGGRKSVWRRREGEA